MTEPMTPEQYKQLPTDRKAEDEIYALLYAIYEQGRCSYDGDKAAAKEAAQSPAFNRVRVDDIPNEMSARELTELLSNEGKP